MTFNIFVGAGAHNQGRKGKPSLILSTYDPNGGLLTTDTIAVTNTVSSVVPIGEPQQTSEIAITAVNPNPARSTIDVDYILDANEQAKLEICNTLGLQVGVLADGYQNRGKHTARFIVGGLPAGTYYLRLSTYNGQATVAVKVVH